MISEKKYVIDYETTYYGKTVFVRDMVVIIPVTIRSVPSEFKSKIGSALLTFKYIDRLRRLKYYSTNNENVWSVYPILSKDQEQAAHYYD